MVNTVLGERLSSCFGSTVTCIILTTCFFFSNIFFCGCYVICGSTDLDCMCNGVLLVVLFVVPVVAVGSFTSRGCRGASRTLFATPMDLAGIILKGFLNTFILCTVYDTVFLLCTIMVSFFTAPR